MSLIYKKAVYSSQAVIKKQCILTKWVLAQECKVGLMLDNQPMAFTKKENHIICLKYKVK